MAVGALVTVAATVYGTRRADAVRRVLRLPSPGPRRALGRVVLAGSAAALLALAAAQPAVTHDVRPTVRRDTQVLFVFDISRSMAATASPRAATRLDRATRAALRLRGAVPDVAAGVATLTDRVLPDLLPVPDRAGFDQVVARGVAIESPPPRASAVRATSYDALQAIPGSGYFDEKTSSRIVVVLTDGESTPVQAGELAGAFAAQRYHLLFVRFWSADEAIYDNDGRRETAYRPDPAGGAVLETVANALGARVYGEGALGAAERRLRELVGTGPAEPAPGAVRRTTPLAPYAAALALALILALVVPASARSVRWLAT